MLEIRPSPIEGNGVFTTEKILKGTKIVEFTGVEMSYKDFREKYKEDYRYTYITRFPWITVIVAKDNRNIITYINDGVYKQKNPKVNVELKKKWLYAVEDIEADEELLLRYCTRYWTHH